ncbi:MAG: pyridoxamine 5'-phosphate oxidase family protein [Pseudomonadota bacterium]
MAKQFDAIDQRLADFIAAQHMFFVATAAPDGRVNLSPKGGDALRVVGPNRILWRNITGSGNETAGHLLESTRITLMWCSYTTKPMILRCYGTAQVLHPRDDDWAALNGHFPDHVGARQVFDMTVDLVQTSCGYAVPLMTFEQDRDVLDRWSVDKGSDGIAAYWSERNTTTIDGAPTGILE